MTPEQAKKMVGTEFIYVFEDGDEVAAYVKAFDPEIGMTCYSLEPKTKYGWIPPRNKDTLSDGTFCVYGASVKMAGSMAQAYKNLEKIRLTGRHFVEPMTFSAFAGCSF